MLHPKKLPLALLVVISLFSSCSKKKVKIEEQKVNTEIAPVQNGVIETRLTKSGSSYSVYIPKNSRDKYPAMFFFDPHAKGNFPLEKYKGLAEKFGFILIGSNEIQNGIVFERIVQLSDELYNECMSTMPVDKRNVSLAGFSGGGKAALICGSNSDHYSCIFYCGAAVPGGSIEVKTARLGFAGKKDMNYTDVIAYNNSIRENIEHAIVEWNGKHEWPDSAAFRKAFNWQSIIALKKSGIKDDPLFVDFQKSIEEETKDSKDILSKANLLNQEAELFRNTNFALKPMSQFSKIISSNEYREAKQRLGLKLADENEKKEMYASSFEQKDMHWWTNQANLLNRDSTDENQRLLGYISLASWTYSTKAIAMNNLSLAQKALNIYKLADPENPEQPYLQACFFSKIQANDSALFYLDKAVNLGFKDRAKMENEKDLLALRSRNEFNQIVSKIH